MKRMLLFALTMIVLSPAAFAEADGYWTSNADWYYHQSEHCGGAGDMVPISLDGAEAFGKYACPICVAIQGDDREPKVLNCFGQLAVRIPESWLWDLEYRRSPEQIDGVHERGTEAMRTLGQCLHGRAYNTFLEELRSAGAASGTAFTASVERMNCEVLSARHIGDAWYVGVRPAADPMQGWDAMVCGWRIELEMSGDELDTHMDVEPERTHLTLIPEDVASVYQRADSGLWIHVYPMMDVYYLILSGETGSNLEGATLRLYIDGKESDVDLWPIYIEDAVDLGCALTEAEYHALAAGAELVVADLEGNIISFDGNI